MESLRTLRMPSVVGWERGGKGVGVSGGEDVNQRVQTHTRTLALCPSP